MTTELVQRAGVGFSGITAVGRDGLRRALSGY